LTFSATYDDMGAVRTVEFRRGGATMPVTQASKREFVSAYVKWYAFFVLFHCLSCGIRCDSSRIRVPAGF
jgi:hypothetical protein